MRYQIPAAIVCDGCGRPGDGFRQVTVVPGEQGPMNLERVMLPDRWVSVLVQPTLAVVIAPGTPPPDPFAHNAMDLARESGVPIEAAFCGACKTKAGSKRIVGEALGVARELDRPANVTADPAAAAADEREQQRDAERRAQEAAAEQAEHEAFEQRKRESAAQGGA